jgi:hypothetical protein
MPEEGFRDTGEETALTRVAPVFLRSWNRGRRSSGFFF